MILRCKETLKQAYQEVALTRSPCSAIDSDIQVKKIYGVGDDVGLVFLLLTLNIFNIFFCCVYCWLWTIRCWLSNYLLSRKTSTQKVCYKSSGKVPEQFVKSVQNGQQNQWTQDLNWIVVHIYFKIRVYVNKGAIGTTWVKFNWNSIFYQILLTVLIFLTSKVSSKFKEPYSHNMTETIFFRYFTRGL